MNQPESSTARRGASRRRMSILAAVTAVAATLTWSWTQAPDAADAAPPATTTTTTTRAPGGTTTTTAAPGGGGGGGTTTTTAAPGGGGGTTTTTAAPGGGGGGATTTTAAPTTTTTIPGPTMSPAGGTLPTGVVDTAYSQTLTVSGGANPYTWSATGLPAGLSMSRGVISGTPTDTVNNASISVTVTDKDGRQDTKTFRLTITLPSGPVMSPGGGTLTAGTVDAAYTATLSVSGGRNPYTWGASGLPAGLTINNSGVISGTPTDTVNNASFTVTVTDKDGQFDTETFRLTIGLPSGPVMSPAGGNLTAGTVDADYSQTLTVSGGRNPYTWSATGLPTGLSIDNKGVISGTATDPVNNRSVSVTVTDRDGQQDTQTFRLTIGLPSGPVMSPAGGALTGGTRGSSYSVDLDVSGGRNPYTWSASGLPAGLDINNQGVISGTPTQTKNGNVTVTVTDKDGQQDTETFNLRIVHPVLSITTSVLDTGIVGTNFSGTVASTGGTGVYSYTLDSGSLPDGLSLATDGSISGRPSASGTYNFRVLVTDSDDVTDVKALTIVVLDPLAITTSSLPPATRGHSFSASIAGTGGAGAYVFSLPNANSLPDGLSMDADGNITGSPTSPVDAVVTFDVRLTDKDFRTTTKQFTISVAAQPLEITTDKLPKAKEDKSYNKPIEVAGGKTNSAKFKVKEGALPPGLSLNEDSGEIEGTPEEAADTTITVEVTDADGRKASREYELVVYGVGTLKPAHVGATNPGFSDPPDETCPVLEGYPFAWHFVVPPRGDKGTSFNWLKATFDRAGEVEATYYQPTRMHAYVYTQYPDTLRSITAELNGPDKEVVLSHVCGGSAEFEVTKTADVDQVESAGDTVVFTIEIDNTGTLDLTNVVGVDTLDYSEATCPLIYSSGNDGDAIFETDETWTFTCTYTVTQADIDRGAILNTVSVTAKYGDDEIGPEEDSASVGVDGSSGLTVVKSANPTVVSEAGETVTFTVVARNVGDYTLTDLEMTDSLGDDCVLQRQSGNPASVAPGASVTYTCQYVVTADDIDAGSITNVATGTAIDPDENEVEADDDAVVDVQQDVELDVQKTANPTTVSAAGETVTFTVVATNTGNVTLSNLQMADSLGSACSLQRQSGNPATMAPSASVTYTCSYTVTEADITEGRIVNVATGTASDPDGGSVVDSDDAVVTTEEAAIEVVKSASPTVVSEAGQVVTFTVVVTNIGEVNLRDLQMSDSLGDDCVLQRQSGNESRIRPDGSVTFTCEYTVTEDDLIAGEIVNVATGTANTPGGAEVTDSDDAVVDVEVDIDVEIAIQNQSLDPATGVAVWNVGIKNNSPLATPGPVEIVITPPAGGAITRDMCTGKQPWKETDPTGPRSWTCVTTRAAVTVPVRGIREAGLDPFEEVQYVVVTVGGDLTNLVLGGSVAVDGDTVEGNNVASDVVRVDEAPPVLPETGWDARTGLTIGAILLLAGIALQAPSRRRRSISKN